MKRLSVYSDECAELIAIYTELHYEDYGDLCIEDPISPLEFVLNRLDDFNDYLSEYGIEVFKDD